ncbi:ATP-binding cassette sub-family G member 5 [Elysia marginata]|uniref:ATP-binding cassette sub-family G member 5 n=1 Tax=Elysia marginata TaxID=1093978 RepID=A0AAV4HMH5_9GAST|nr:ATP-binding cassette sub-family G member 5 [Elysia marginata]
MEKVRTSNVCFCKSLFGDFSHLELLLVVIVAVVVVVVVVVVAVIVVAVVVVVVVVVVIVVTAVAVIVVIVVVVVVVVVVVEKENLLPRTKSENLSRSHRPPEHQYGSLRTRDVHVSQHEGLADCNDNTLTRSTSERPSQTAVYGSREDVSSNGPVHNDVVRSSPRACLNVIGLSYTVKEKSGHWWNRSLLHKAKDKQVLQNLSMTFNKGEMTAIVGTSGSGKTSLLDVISGRAEGEVDGVVSYKHHQCRLHMMREKSSYVLQADRLLPTLTVRETLTYMALMKLPGTLSSEQIDRKVRRRGSVTSE